MGSKKPTLREQLAAAEAIRNSQARKHAIEIRGLKAQIDIERLGRIAAQRGLVPYVRSLEAFNGWLHERPDLAIQVEAVMRELGLWAIKLGYDPDKDVTLSVVSSKRMQDSA